MDVILKSGECETDVNWKIVTSIGLGIEYTMGVSMGVEWGVGASMGGRVGNGGASMGKDWGY